MVSTKKVRGAAHRLESFAFWLVAVVCVGVATLGAVVCVSPRAAPKTVGGDGSQQHAESSQNLEAAVAMILDRRDQSESNQAGGSISRTEIESETAKILADGIASAMKWERVGTIGLIMCGFMVYIVAHRSPTARSMIDKGKGKRCAERRRGDDCGTV